MWTCTSTYASSCGDGYLCLYMFIVTNLAIWIGVCVCVYIYIYKRIRQMSGCACMSVYLYYDIGQSTGNPEQIFLFPSLDNFLVLTGKEKWLAILNTKYWWFVWMKMDRGKHSIYARDSSWVVSWQP